MTAKPPPSTTWQRGVVRSKRALFVSSPIGLGHAWRDVAIADELRRQVPGLAIDWLAQEPVTTVLRQRGETIHPASAALASEVAHIDREAGEHDLHAFQALRRMDEIFCANFMVFHDLVREERFDVWIADEGWEIDYFLHENPELKTAPYAWLTDFVGYLPMPAGGDHEASLTADYNAEMIEHIERHPRVRDRAIFVGDADDIVPDASALDYRGSANGRSATTASPATCPASTFAPLPTGPRSVPSSATETGRSVSSRSAVPASARRCCGV